MYFCKEYLFFIERKVFLLFQSKLKIIFHEFSLECRETSYGIAMPVRVRRGVDRSIWIAPSRELGELSILAEISIVERSSHPLQSLSRRCERVGRSTIRIPDITDIVRGLEVIAESRLSESDTDHEAGIDMSIESGIYPHLPLVEVWSRICF